MQRVTIEGDLQTNNGRSNSGKEFTERYQQAYLHAVGSKYPKSCKLMLWDNARPYPPGDYETAQELEINEFGKLRVKTDLVLTPAAPQKAG